MRPNIIIIIIDALRSKNLGCYGYDKATSSNIDELAKNGVLFKNAFSTTNATDSSITSILSGEYPSTHGIKTHGEKVRKEHINTFERSGAVLLQEILKRKGYETIGIDFLNRWHKKGYKEYLPKEKTLSTFIKNVYKKSPQILKEIERRIYKKIFPKRRKLGEMYTKIAINKIKEHSTRENPFFLFIHYWDTHIPYTPPKKFFRNFLKAKYREQRNINEILKEIDGEWKKRLKKFTEEIESTTEMLARYDGCIKYIDKKIEEIMVTLKNCNIFDDTLMILTSDHGESLTEHGIYFDHHGLYDESIKVPLIFSCPKKFDPMEIEEFVQHVDIFPTILEILGLRKSNNVDGISLLPLIKRKEKIRDFIFAEEAYTEKKMCIRTKTHKYIYSKSDEKAFCRYCGKIHGGREELYDLGSDPKEMENIVKEKPRLADRYKNDLLNFVSNLKRKGEKSLISAGINKLKREGKI